jgi:hypothetical protein
MSNTDYAGCVILFFGWLVLLLIFAAIGAYLVQVSLGYFGVHLTLWESYVVAITVSWLCKSSPTTSK